MLLPFLFSISTVIVFVLLETDALAEYFTKLRIPLPFLKEYMAYRKTATGVIHYVDYLCLQRDNFFTRLIGCPVCLLFNFNVLLHLLIFPVYGAIVFYWIFPNVLLGWIVYFTLRILSRLADEQSAQK